MTERESKLMKAFNAIDEFFKSEEDTDEYKITITKNRKDGRKEEFKVEDFIGEGRERSKKVSAVADKIWNDLQEERKGEYKYAK